MIEKKLILIEKSKDDILTDLLMCNAKKLLKYYDISDLKRISLSDFNRGYLYTKIKISKNNLPVLLCIEGKKVINRLEGFQYLEFMA